MPLVDYGSSSEEEVEDESSLTATHEQTKETLWTGRISTKRILQTADNSEQCKRKKTLPPLPSSLTELFKERERPADNPELHQGRIRGRAHVNGSWPVHVYLEVKLSGELFDIVKSLIVSARKTAPKVVSLLQSTESHQGPKTRPTEAEAAVDTTELHISLTRPLYLQELHHGRFTSDVKDAFKGKKRFNVSFSGVQSFSNDEKTRSFLSLRVGAGHAEIESLVAEMDVIAQRYSQPKFYDNPQLHASFAWAVGGDVLDAKTVAAMSELEGELGRDLRHCSITVRRVAWKIGQKVGSVAFQ